MIEFIHDLGTNEFLRNGLLIGLLASIACGVIGAFVVARRITYIAGGIAHSVLGGMGAAQYFRVKYSLEFLHPLHGAIIAGLVSALIIGLVSLRAKEREDTVIGAIWAVGMAIGILFIYKTPGYNQDLMSYLFGNILLASTRDLWMVAALDVVVVLLGLLLYNQFTAVCFDEEFARLRGLRVDFYFLLLLCLTALTVVLMVTVVGIVLVIALLTLPVAIAGHFSKALWQMMLLGVLISVGLTTTGLVLSYDAELPSGATIILVAGVAYLAVLLFQGFRKKRTNGH